MKNFLFLISISFCASSFSMEGGLSSPVRSTGSSVGHSSDDLTSSSFPLTPRKKALAAKYLNLHEKRSAALLEESRIDLEFLFVPFKPAEFDEDGFDGIHDGVPHKSAVFRAENAGQIGNDSVWQKTVELPFGCNVPVRDIANGIATFVAEECKDVVIPPHLQKMLKFFQHCQSYAAKNSASPAPTAPAQATETPK